MSTTFLGHLPAPTSPLGVVSTVAVVGTLLLYLLERFVLGVPLPEGIQLVREPEGARPFSLRTRLAYFIDCEALFRDAYVHYVKKGKPVVIPGFGLRNEVIMPQSSMKWLLAQPEEVLNVNQAFAEVDQVRWSLGHEKYVADPWQGMLVKIEMNRVLESICAAMNDELGVAFDENFGTDTENWKRLISAMPCKWSLPKPAVASPSDFLYVSCPCSHKASGRAAHMPRGREKEYLRICTKLNQLLIINAGFIGGLPQILRPVIGSLFNFWIYLSVRKLKPFFLSLWRQRIATLTWDRDDTSHDEPQDHFQLMLRYAQRERPEELHDNDTLMRRLIAANFGAIHQTQIQVTNLILNVLGSDAEFSTMAVLRDEVDRVLGPGDREWTKSLVSQLTRADSISRETLRLQSFGGRSVFRKVMVSDLTMPGGYHLPKVTLLSFLSQPAHLDPDTLDESAKFDPFRYSRLKELAASRDEKMPSISLVSTSPEFLPFGHGKHACPGRFLIDFELKMILAYVLRNYDISFPENYGGKRPPNVWMAEAVVPPPGARIRVKRRARTCR